MNTGSGVPFPVIDGIPSDEERRVQVARMKRISAYRAVKKALTLAATILRTDGGAHMDDPALEALRQAFRVVDEQCRTAGG